MSTLCCIQPTSGVKTTGKGSDRKLCVKSPLIHQFGIAIQHVGFIICYFLRPNTYTRCDLCQDIHGIVFKISFGSIAECFTFNLGGTEQYQVLFVDVELKHINRYAKPTVLRHVKWLLLKVNEIGGVWHLY